MKTEWLKVKEAYEKFKSVKIEVKSANEKLNRSKESLMKSIIGLSANESEYRILHIEKILTTINNTFHEKRKTSKCVSSDRKFKKGSNSNLKGSKFVKH